MRMRFVSRDMEVFETVIEDRIGLARDLERRQRQRLARKLRANLLEMVVVQMAVAARPDEIPTSSPVCCAIMCVSIA